MDAFDLIALGSLLVSGLVGLGGLRLWKRQVRIEERIGERQLEELELRAESRHRARIRLRATTDRLWVRNVGEGPARDVVVEIMCPDGTSAFPSYIDVFPIVRIDPHEEIPVAVSWVMGCDTPLPATVKWTDPDGQERAGNLTVY